MLTPHLLVIAFPLASGSLSQNVLHPLHATREECRATYRKPRTRLVTLARIPLCLSLRGLLTHLRRRLKQSSVVVWVGRL